MPTYEYKCDACGHAFEKFHSMSADPIKVCPVCGKESVRRLIGTGAGLIFKGSGFYITDYRDPGYKDSAKADGDKSKSDGGAANKDGGKSGGDSGGSNSGSGESKPAATSGDSSAKPAAKTESAPAPKPAATPTPTPTSAPDDKR